MSAVKSRMEGRKLERSEYILYKRVHENAKQLLSDTADKVTTNTRLSLTGATIIRTEESCQRRVLIISSLIAKWTLSEVICVRSWPEETKAAF